MRKVEINCRRSVIKDFCRWGDQLSAEKESEDGDQKSAAESEPRQRREISSQNKKWKFGSRCWIPDPDAGC